MLCVHGLSKKQKDSGLDLILHTPGGNMAATHSLIHYLKSIFGCDIRAIVPQIAMSAGTIIACSCKSILMGKTSNLGPIDPQMGPHPAIAIKAQFEKAYSDIIANPRSAEVWRPLLSTLGPSILQQCDGVIKWASEFVEESLKSNMYADLANAEDLAKKATLTLTQEGHYGHSKHFHIGECEAMGLNIEKLEDDQHLQELVLTIHHTYMHTLEILNAFKIIENNLGNGITKIAAR